MKAIKIEEATVPQLTAALAEANGRHTAHAMTKGADLVWLAEMYDGVITKITGAKKHLAGSRVTHISGESVPNSYKYQRVGTCVTIERRSSSWYLIDASTTAIYKEGGRTTIALTEAQDAAAVAHLRKQYCVIKNATV